MKCEDMIVGSGNIYGHHKYEVCPKCGKKGYYTPKSEWDRLGGLIEYKPTCVYCRLSGVRI